jgi:ADP-heptose:LPS heptosyltransferase
VPAPAGGGDPRRPERARGARAAARVRAPGRAGRPPRGRGAGAAPRPVVITAGPGEWSLARAVAECSGASVFAGGLRDLAALVADAARVVCADTGVAHLATAFGTPSVVLFGPSSPARWGPPTDRPQHRALWAGSPGEPNGARPDPGLLALQPHDVLEAIA